MEEWINLISNVGFPIAVAIALAWFIYQIFLKTTEQNAQNMAQVQARCAEREDRLYEEIARSREEIAKGREINEKAIDTIAHYAEKLDTIQNDIQDIKTDITVIMTKQ